MVLLPPNGTQGACVESSTNLFPSCPTFTQHINWRNVAPPPSQRRFLNNNPLNAKSGCYRLWGNLKWTAYKASSPPSTPALDISAKHSLGRSPKPTNHGRHHIIGRFGSPPQPNELTNPSPHPLDTPRMPPILPSPFHCKPHNHHLLTQAAQRSCKCGRRPFKPTATTMRRIWY